MSLLISTLYNLRERRYTPLIQVAFLLYVLCAFFPLPCEAIEPQCRQLWIGNIVKIADVDTITVIDPKTSLKRRIRLWGIDGPESGQERGGEATLALNAILSEQVIVQECGTDRYNRLLALLYTPSGESIQELLISQGWVWVYDQYCNKHELCDKWRRLQIEAEDSGLGLWQDPDPVPPWEWRRENRIKRARTQ